MFYGVVIGRRLRRHGLIFWRLSWAERGWLMQAWLMLHGVALALRWVSFQRVYGFLGRWSLGSGQALADEGQILAQTRAIVRLVQGAAAWNVHLWWLLRRQGVASELRIGVRKEQGRFEAHAWVEREGVALNDGSDVNVRFAAFQGL